MKDNENINHILSEEDIMPFIIHAPYLYHLHLGFLFKLNRISKQYYIDEIDKILSTYPRYSLFDNYDFEDQVLEIKLDRDLFLKNIDNYDEYCK